jgi:hydroxymethylglutaryl-CoA reductase (NADPH)
MSSKETTHIPTRWLGPLYFQSMQSFDVVDSNVTTEVPLATFETTLFYSVSRGMRAIQQSGGLISSMIHDSMVRSVTLEVETVATGQTILQHLQSQLPQLQKEVVQPRSQFAKLLEIKGYFVGRLLYLRIAIDANNASGHNMVTSIADGIVDYVLNVFPTTRYVSVSGNMCVDKKVSVINALEGRGKHVISEVMIPRKVVEDVLKTTPEKMVELNIKKNLVGSIMAGSIHSANAHVANMLLACYLATGQDGANVVEGSQGITFTEVKEGNLYFSINLPNLIVGTVGNGKNEGEMASRFERMGCQGERGGRRYAHLIAGTVLAGELSLLAALTNPHELVDAHLRIERK